MFIGNCAPQRLKTCVHLRSNRACMRPRAAHRAATGWPSGNFSARYSRIASDSQTRVSPSISTGTLPAPLKAVSRALKSGASSGITVSSNAIRATFMASHGRNDQDE